MFRCEKCKGTENPVLVNFTAYGDVYAAICPHCATDLGVFVRGLPEWPEVVGLRGLLEYAHCRALTDPSPDFSNREMFSKMHLRENELKTIIAPKIAAWIRGGGDA